MLYRRFAALSVVLIAAGLLGWPSAAQQPGGEDAVEAHERVMKEAVAKVAPSVVQIQTTGGADQVAVGPKGVVFRKGTGPTTGVIVSADGYIISSAFNFINNPTSILVAVPGRKEPLVATKVATDKSRMLTLLKVDAKGLPVPQAVPEKDIQVGQWAIALGRTLDLKREQPPSVSVGIISAVGRIWGKAIQTDAKVSPVNYGGPLVDVTGRVQGILIPASPRGEEETAGFEWYDSGIGFAIPMEHVLSVLPRLSQGKDLNKGTLGITVTSKDIYAGAPTVGQVLPKSAAARAGLKAGDTLVELDGKPVVRQAQVLHILGTKYEGDKVSLKYRRDGKVVEVKDLVLAGDIEAFTHPFLGILPMRDDPALGVEVRYVYPKSPAEAAGIKAGDRIVKVGTTDKKLAPFTGQKRGRDELLELLNTLPPDTELQLEVARDGGKKTEVVKLKLAALPGTSRQNPDLVPGKLPAKASKAKGLEPLETPDGKGNPLKVDLPAKAETGFFKRTTAGGDIKKDWKYWMYVHEDYDPNVAHALVVWLHPPGKGTEEAAAEFAEIWEDYCKENHIILVGPKSDNDDGWIPSDSDFILEVTRDVMKQYNIDRQRVVAHGMGVGGQMAIYLGFAARDMFRGVATTGAVVTEPKGAVAAQRLAFYLSAGDRDPLAKAVSECRTKLTDQRIPAFYREIPERGREYLPAAAVAELARWIDALDKQ